MFFIKFWEETVWHLDMTCATCGSAGAIRCEAKLSMLCPTVLENSQYARVHVVVERRPRPARRINLLTLIYEGRNLAVRGTNT